MGTRFEDDDGGVVTETKKETRLARPRMWRVLVHNDDYTTREFVVDVLRSVFRHSESEAVRVMLHVHYNGVGVAGVYTREVAETKIAIVESLAKEREYPLRLTMEPEEPDESGGGSGDVGGSSGGSEKKH
ncbi:MAG: ATP-dependent Clp protease adaptor ClpS [Sandaracinus sp.]